MLHKTFLALGAAAGWFAVILQLLLMVDNRAIPSIGETVVRFFTFFTILTNILLAIYFTVLLFSRKSRLRKWFERPVAGTALAVYILLVGTVYNVVLRSLWDPVGLQETVDELLHTAIPIYFFIYWLLYVPKQSLRWRDVFPWMWFPFLYLLWALAWGALSAWYPYPFLDAGKLGYGQVALNSLMVFGVFLFFSLLMVGIAKLMRGSAR